MSNLRARWFPSLAQEQAQRDDEERRLARQQGQMNEWIKNPEFDRLIDFIEQKIVSSEPGEGEPDPVFKSGMVKGLRLAEGYLKTRRSQVKEIVDG